MLCWYTETQAQETLGGKPGFYLEAGVFVNSSSVTEQKFSSLMYYGFTPGFVLRARLDYPRIQHHLELGFSGGRLETDKPASASLSENLFNIDYYNLFSIYQSGNERFTIQAGAVLDLLYNQRFYSGFINSVRSFETIISLGGTGRVAYRLGEGTYSVSLADRFSIPILYYYSQPGFSGIIDGGFNVNAGNTENHFAFIPEVFLFANDLTLEKPLNEKMVISIFYNWNYCRIDSSREVRHNSQQIGITFRFKI